MAEIGGTTFLFLEKRKGTLMSFPETSDGSVKAVECISGDYAVQDVLQKNYVEGSRRCWWSGCKKYALLFVRVCISFVDITPY